jgi:hypothetical protein
VIVRPANLGDIASFASSLGEAFTQYPLMQFLFADALGGPGAVAIGFFLFSSPPG